MDRSMLKDLTSISEELSTLVEKEAQTTKNPKGREYHFVSSAEDSVTRRTDVETKTPDLSVYGADGLDIGKKKCKAKRHYKYPGAGLP